MVWRMIAQSSYVVGQEGWYDFYFPDLGAVRESHVTLAIYGCAVQPSYFEFLGQSQIFDLCQKSACSW
jgi:hypothetical protein